MARSPLVPSVAPLVESLQRFTPDARENRRLELAGLEQMQDLRGEQLRGQQLANTSQQLSNEANQAINIGRQALVEFNEDINDIDSVLDGPPESVANNISRLLAEKQNDETFDNEDALELRSMAIENPTNAINELQRRRDEILRNRDTAQRNINILSGQNQTPGVKATDILEDGSTIQILNNGTEVVKDPQGRVVTGQDRQDVIANAAKFGSDVQAQRSASRKGATDTEARASNLIERGIAAAESTATIRRGIDLLDTVKTGGVNAISLSVKQRLGIEGANEGELSNSLGKSVLSQLRETFGAAFTAAEGAQLQRIEASFSKSPDTNRRLLQQALRIAERTARRGVKAAQKRGNEDEVKDINDLLQFNLDIETETPSQTKAVPKENFTTQSGITFTVE